MTMVLRKPLFRNDSFSRNFGRDSRPMLKIPCARYSTSLDSGRSSYFENSFNADVSSTSSTSSRLTTGLVTLSTPSPSATANGNKVDIEFEKFRRLSEEWIRSREIEEAENIVDSLGSRSPSPQRIFSKPYRRSTSQPPIQNNSREDRSPSPERSPERSYKSPVFQRGESPFRSVRSRSPSPLVFSTATKRFVRSNSYEGDNANNGYASPSRSSTSSRESSLPPSPYRRSSSLDGERKYYSLPSRSPSPQRYTPVSSIFKRSSSSYENDERIRSNFRSRSTSPQRLTPASSYYRRQNNSGGSENGFYSPNYSQRSSQQSSPHFLSLFNRNNNNSSSSTFETKPFNSSNYNSLNKFYTDSSRTKYHSLPRNLFSTKTNSSNRDNFSNIFDQNSLINASNNNNNQNNDINKRVFDNRNFTNSNNSGCRFNNIFCPAARQNLTKSHVISSNRNPDNQFLSSTLPDLPNHRMTSPRRFSEEPSPFRRPLATLHEDEVVARRRFSDGIRKRSYDTSDVYSDYQAHQRKLSEAGVRKLSDASVVLTADTDSFIIGDRVWVGGTKPGTITYIGETQFAPGEWAGITLDEPIGKNNGSVGGFRYFQCEPKKGIFSRLTRLSRAPLSDYDLEILGAKSSTRGSESPRSTPSKDSAPSVGRKITPAHQSGDLYRKNSQSSEIGRKITPSSPGARSPLHGKSGSPSPSGSVKKGPPPYTGITDLKLGERVIIDSTSGTKYGVLRYLGRTEFADGIWAGVELDDPTGKNDGSVAGKKYFICRSNYGLFAPIARVRSFAHRSSASRSALPPLRRSGSRESIGASSAASSTVSSSLRGTRRPSRTSGSGSAPTTKALQETLAEKTLHVDQLMKERDVERGEMARIASQLEEATRIAHNFKMQLDQLQIESEERLHDFGEKVQGLEQDKKDLFAKLEDKQKEIDDLNFRIEEETFAKADFESQSITHNERLKELEKELEGEKKRLKERKEKEAQKEDEMEGMELNLRLSIEELQAKVMEMEQEKENLEKKLEELEEKSKTLETVNSSLSNSVNEKEQKINLLEATRITEEEREREREELVNDYESRIRGYIEELERKAKDCEDVSQQAEEFLSDLEVAKKQLENKEKEYNELKEKLKNSSDSEISLKEEFNEYKSSIKTLENSLSEEKQKVQTLQDQKEEVEKNISQFTEEISKLSAENESFRKSLIEKDEENKTLKEDLLKKKEDLLSSENKLGKEKETIEKQNKKIEESENEIKSLQEKIKTLENDKNTSISEINDLTRKVAELERQIQEVEESRKRIEGQLEVAMSSSTTSSDQLRSLNQELRDAEAKAEAATKAERETASLLEKEKELYLGNIESLKKSREETESKLSKELSDLIIVKSELESKMAAMEEARELYKKEVKEEKEELERKLEEEVKRHKEELATKEDEKIKVEERLKTLLEEANKNYKNLLEQFENNKTIQKAENETFSKEKEEVLKKCTILESSIDELKAEKSNILTEMKSKEELLNQSEGKIKLLAEQVENMKSQLHTYQENLKEQISIAEEDQKDVAFLKTALEEEKVQINSLEEALDHIKLEKDTILEEKTSLMQQIEKLKAIENEKNHLLSNQSNLEEQLKILSMEKEKNQKLLEEKNRLEEELKQINILQIEKNQIKEHAKRLEEELEELQCLKSEFDNLKGASSNLETKLEKMADLERELENLKCELVEAKKVNKELSETCKEMSTIVESNKQLIDKNNLQGKKIKEMEEEKGKLVEDIESLKASAQNLTELESRYKHLKQLCEEQEKNLESEKKNLVSANIEMESSVEDLKKSYASRISDLEIEKGNLVEEVVNLQEKYSQLNTEKEQEIKSMKDKINEAKTPSSDRESAELRLKILGLESEKRKLENEIKNLKDEIAVSCTGNGERNEFVVQLKQERDQFEGQVNFLNSVIVDMKRKKDELETKIEVLQSGNLPDDQKASLNGLTEFKAVAPRLFCDICDCFDLHDTEDCPRQTSGDSPPPTQYHADRHAVRKYCDSCEVFGHEEGECPLDETF